MWPNPQIPADMVTFTEEILNRKFHFLCSGRDTILANAVGDVVSRYDLDRVVVARAKCYHKFFQITFTGFFSKTYRK